MADFPLPDARAPKAFVSHAWEDKEKFVIPFAEWLRKRGVDAWLDKWEMKAGDSLVDKIFEEGIRNAEAFIVVLSEISVQKKWVREELNAAVVKRIEAGTRLIPIRLGNCEVPEALRSTLWVPVLGLDDPDKIAATVADIMHGVNTKPPIGPPPAYLAGAFAFRGLKPADEFILALACRRRIDGPKDEKYFQASKLLDDSIQAGIPEEAFWESVEFLAHGGFLSGHRYIESRDGRFEVGTGIFEEYLKVSYPNYAEIERSIAFEFINGLNPSFEALAARFSVPVVVLNHVLSQFKSRGWIEGLEFESGRWRVTRVHAAMKRAFEAQ